MKFSPFVGGQRGLVQSGPPRINIHWMEGSLSSHMSLAALFPLAGFICMYIYSYLFFFIATAAPNIFLRCVVLRSGGKLDS